MDLFLYLHIVVTVCLPCRVIEIRAIDTKLILTLIFVYIFLTGNVRVAIHLMFFGLWNTGISCKGARYYFLKLCFYFLREKKKTIDVRNLHSTLLLFYSFLEKASITCTSCIKLDELIAVWKQQSNQSLHQLCLIDIKLNVSEETTV